MSQYIVKIFDPNTDPTVDTMLETEKSTNPKVVSISARSSRMGLVASSQHGTFWLDNEGRGGAGSVDKHGCPIKFYRNIDGKLETAPFATATYSLDDCLACMTGESMPLEQFIDTGQKKHVRLSIWQRHFAWANGENNKDEYAPQF